MKAGRERGADAADDAERGAAVADEEALRSGSRVDAVGLGPRPVDRIGGRLRRAAAARLVRAAKP